MKQEGKENKKETGGRLQSAVEEEGFECFTGVIVRERVWRAE